MAIKKTTHWIGVIASWSAMRLTPQALFDAKSRRRRVDGKHATFSAATKGDAVRLWSGEQKIINLCCHAWKIALPLCSGAAWKPIVATPPSLLHH